MGANGTDESRGLRVLTGVLLILTPIAFNVFFTLLSVTFEYPTSCANPQATSCDASMRGQLPRRHLVWVHADCSAVRAAGGPGAQGSNTPGHALHGSRNRLRSRRRCSAVSRFGSLAVPGPLPGGCLPRSGISGATRESVAVVFQAFNQYAGVGVGENLGYLFTGLWTLLVALAMFGSALPLRRWLGLLGVVSAVGIVLGMLESAGFEAAANIVVVGYILWSIWLASFGIFLLLPRSIRH